MAVEAALAIDRADDLVERHDLPAGVALLHAPEGGDDLVEGQDDVDVAALAAEEAREAGDRLATPRAQEVVLRVGRG
jgi:hypothetical protein